MIKKIVHKIAKRHHPWKGVEFDELAEMYASMTIRSFGFSIIGIFVPLYLYKFGVSLADVFLFSAYFFIIRVPVSYVSGKVIGRIGPKHSIAVSTVILLLFLTMLLTYELYTWPLMLLAAIYTAANGLFFIAYNTDFSKIQHKEHGGKELGWLYIFERIGAAAGPFIGGLIASFIAPEATIVFAFIVLSASLIPLFLSSEPIKTHQKVDYNLLDVRKYKYDFIALCSFNAVNVTNTFYWPLYLGVVIFSTDVFAKVGSIIAVATVISMLGARYLGKAIDSKRGYYMLRYGVLMTVVSNVSRSLISTPGGATAVTILEEPVSLSYKMPLAKGAYDRADSLGPNRIAYLTILEMETAVVKAAFSMMLFIGSLLLEPELVLRYCFIVAAFAALFMLKQRFPVLKKV